MLKGIPHSSKQEEGAKVAEPPLIKIGLVLLIIGLGLCIPATTHATSPVLRAGPAELSQPFFTGGISPLGAPNGSPRLASREPSANRPALVSQFDPREFFLDLI